MNKLDGKTIAFKSDKYSITYAYIIKMNPDGKNGYCPFFGSFDEKDYNSQPYFRMDKDSNLYLNDDNYRVLSPSEWMKELIPRIFSHSYYPE